MSPTASTTPTLSRPHRWLVLAVMSLGTLLVFLDTTAINTAIPSISTDLGASTAQLQWVVDAYVLVLAGLLLLGGSIGDRFGRRRWMTVGLVVFLGGSVMGALASDIGTLIAARAVQGLGAALVLPATLSIVTNVFPRRERPRAIAVWTAVSGLGIGIGPAVGGYVVERFDWSAVFWLHIPVLVVALAGQLVVPETRDPRRVGLDFPGAATATLGVGALVFAVIQGGEQGWTAPEIIGAFAASAALLGAFAFVETRVPYPMLPIRFFRQRDFAGSVLILGAVFFAGVGALFFLTQFLQLVQGRGPFEAGLMILPNVAGIMIASMLAQALVPRVGPRRVLIAAVLVMAGATVLFTTIAADTGTLALVLNMLAFGFGFGLAAQPLTDTVMAAVPVEDAGIGSAVNDVSRELGSALGIAIIGSVVASLYRGNVEQQLAGEVPAPVSESAKESIGVVVAGAETLPPEVAATSFAGAAEAFVQAMTTGLWLAAGLLAVASLAAALMLPSRMRAAQAERAEADRAQRPTESLTAPEAAPTV